VEGGGNDGTPSKSPAFHLPPSTLHPVMLAALVAALALAAFALARSRSGIVGLAVAVLFMAGVGMRPKWRLVGIAALAVVAAGTALWFTGDAPRLARFEEWLRFGSVGPRYFGTVAGLGIFSDHPVLGAGAGTFLLEAPAHLPPEHYLGSYAESFLNLAHNEYAQTLAEGGLLGLGLMLALLGSAIWGGLRGAGTWWKVGGGRWKADAGAGVPSPPPSTFHPPPLSSALSLGLAVATAGVAASSLADPSLRLWDFTAFFYAAAALAAAGADGRLSAFGFRPSEQRPFPEPAVPRAECRMPNADSASSGLRPPAYQYAILGLGAAIAVATAVFWAIPDARREMDHCRAESAEARGNWAEAAGFYEKAAAGRGDFLSRTWARTSLVSVLDFAGRHTKNPAQGQPLIRRSLEEAQGLSAMIPQCPLILRKLAAARFSNGDRAGALVALVQAGRRDPYDRDFWMRFGRVLASEPEAGRAALVARAGAELGLAAGDLAVLKSLAAAAGRDWTGALKLADGLEPTAVSYLPLWLWRGICLAEAGRAGDALLAFDRHLRVEPLHPNGWYWRARALQAAAAPDARDEAIKAFWRCVALDVEHDQARLELAGLLLAAGRPAEVVKLLGPRLNASRRAVEFAILTAEAHWQLGQKAEALHLLQNLLRRTDDPRVRAALEKLAEPSLKPDQPRPPSP
jgi:tetratricopeptide (TPR) repeat protein